MSKVKYGVRGSLEEVTVHFWFCFGVFFRRRGWKNGSYRTIGLPVMDHVLRTTVRLEYMYTSIVYTYVFSF